MFRKTLLLILVAFAATAMAAERTALIPQPAILTERAGDYQFGPESTVFITPYPGDSVAAMFSRLQPALEAEAGTRFVPSRSSRSSLALCLAPALSPEAYRLDVNPRTGVRIEASSPAGFFYGLTTLRQLLQQGPEIAAVSIADVPRFGWRGFMLDEGRHFFGKDEVKRVLDLMSYYKMNRLHWHLTEDQGWRIEIKKWPKLTEVGAKRGTTILPWGNTLPDSIPYDGFYTQDDIREIVAYAADRFIEIVPEIDIPGHSQAAVAAYPEILACDPENEHKVWEHQGVSADVINVANPMAVKMTCDILDEVIDLFPFGYLHLGGDECPVRKWRDNEQCQARLHEIGSADWRDLQIDYYDQIARHIAAKPTEKHRKLVFWNEVLHGNTAPLPSDITIMAWVGADAAAVDAAKRGFNTILTPQIPYYINRKQSDAPDEPLSQGKGTETLEAVYGYVPMKDVDPSLHNKYLGVQANFWSEYVVTPDFLEYLMLPRLIAVAEAGWTPQARRDYADFTTRLRKHEPLFKARGLNYCPYVFAR